MFEIKYHPDVARSDIPKLDTSQKTRIKQAIESKLITQPVVFGLPLRSTLKGYRKLRVGKMRVVYKIKGKIVYILVIAHRSDVYKYSKNRKS